VGATGEHPPGWPYDIHAYDEVAPILVAHGCRVVIPYLRGYGTTRFLSDATPRNGEQAVLAVDATALMDALGIERATVAGFDWGPGPPPSWPRSGPSGVPRWWP
jgi:pimeloyl-ACP methyl ester carboxylesterase